MEFGFELLGFALRALIIVLAIASILLLIAALRQRGRQAGGQLEVRLLNKEYDKLRHTLEDQVLDAKTLKQQRKAEAKEHKTALKKPQTDRSRLYVLNFAGDIKASQVEQLRQEITAILTLARPTDEVVLRLESGGGLVHAYGLAASQLVRIREAGLKLTVCVDKVAASGGYMMACLGTQIIAAPFAVLGSIGVVAQLPNLHRLLKKHDVDFEVLTAGQYKRTLTVFGENTDSGRAKFQEDLELTHHLFKGFVARYRPQLDIERIATGEVWLGESAFELQLIDALKTSDQYLLDQAKTADLYLVRYSQRRSLPERLGVAAAASAEQALLSTWDKLNPQRF